MARFIPGGRPFSSCSPPAPRSEEEPGGFGGVDALRTHQKVLLKRCEFAFVLHQSNVEAFKIVVRNVVHANLVYRFIKT